MSGTLEMLKETWYTGDTPTQSIVEWVDELGKRLMAYMGGSGRKREGG